jgi:hypothetical protein
VWGREREGGGEKKKIFSYKYFHMKRAFPLSKTFGIK